ncbi:GGDEF/cache domain-containing protein [Butyrivibrio proteoclasticus B316]|uniref:GGDEF/cache domain-containing protein n=1 Tax=Butyrivibrio proteoclasticus (strain ATCC 51982 / DSM 14932 / B316) TaxID=515622 RepID=E0RVK4_BUTPB|nr:sensor domain-containing diguanylate cyclase [Butyrivibrio proteoclasticus]ADL34853.1 GGDEF/cache domain-containing protein [Butyrivibrio proteoclasticus B316]
MGDRLTIIRRQLKRAGARAIIILIVVPLLFCVIAAIILRNFLNDYYEMIHYEDTIKASDLAEDFNPYLNAVSILVESAAEGAEYLVAKRADYDEIHKYLEDISSRRSSTIFNDTDGIYGSINGVYNDGYNWTPYEGYDPRERIWYQEAIEAGGRSVMVEPYVDARTGDIIVTVAKALSDGKDVVAADINLGNFQALTEKLADEYNNHEVMVMDKEGYVITSSFADELGENYAIASSADRVSFYNNWNNSNGKSFVTNWEDKKYLVSYQPIEFGWTAFTIADVDSLYRTLENFTYICIIVIIVIAFAIIVIIFEMTSRRVRADNDLESLKAIANIYTSLHKINFDEDTFEQIMCHNYMANAAIGDVRSEPQKMGFKIASLVTEQRSLDDMMEFVDFSTLNTRLEGKDTIAIEFLGYEHLWHRARFIVVDRHPDRTIKTALFAVELIDDEKRYRDELQYLAETDQLTGITNRGSGEKKIKKIMRLGKGGMFVLFDVDKFKSINDTFGHETGDLVLIAIADKMKHSFREKDIIMRLGGDEFAAFVPGICNRDEGEPVVSRFIEAIESINIPETEGRKINVSVGVAFYQVDDTYGFDELYKRADGCSYESKKTQGCTVTFYTKWFEEQ